MFSIQCSNDFTDDKWRVKPGPTLSAEQPGYFQFVSIHTFNAKILTVWFLLRKSRNYWMRPRMKWSNHSVVRIHLTQNSSFYLPTLFHVLPSVCRPSDGTQEIYFFNKPLESDVTQLKQPLPSIETALCYEVKSCFLAAPNKYSCVHIAMKCCFK